MAGALTSSYNSQIGKGASGARGDDTKTLKSAVLDWISPKGEAIQPPLHRNSKIDRGFNHELTGSLLCPAGLDWNDLQYALVCPASTLMTTLRTSLQIGPKKISEVAKCWFVEINGPSSCTLPRLMTPMIRGVASLEAACLYQCVICVFS
jgi:hypothetical protein